MKYALDPQNKVSGSVDDVTWSITLDAIDERIAYLTSKLGTKAPSRSVESTPAWTSLATLVLARCDLADRLFARQTIN